MRVGLRPYRERAVRLEREPDRVKGNSGLEAVYLTEREYSRQQVNFPANSAQVSISSGDGFEKVNLQSIDLANNCLNAGYWEIILNTKEEGKKAVYYQAWFTFPMGMYKDLFEQNNNTSYWSHHWRLEHWQDFITIARFSLRPFNHQDGTITKNFGITNTGASR